MKSVDQDVTRRKGFPNDNHSTHEGGADAGTRQAAGKSNLEDAVLRKGLQPKPEPVRQAVADAGAHKRAVSKQVDGDSDHKRRNASTWGIKES